MEQLNIHEISLDAPKENNDPTISIDGNSDKVINANLGDGIELLMNDKIKNSSSSNNLSSQENKLEKELNDVSKLDDIGISDNDYTDKDSFKNKPKFEIAKDTSKLDVNTDTWDGFKDINNVNIERESQNVKKMTDEELLKNKFEMLRKLDAIEMKGATISKKYTMDDDLDEMRGEYEFLINEKEKSNSIKFQGKVLTTMITGLEFLNNKFDPFDIKLDGWSEQINENVEDYDEIFAELHEKYKSKAKMAPEIKLLFQLASSGIMIHMTNTMFKSSLPGMDDIMRQNPDLMNQFTKAAMDSMENTQPGLNGFMRDFNQPNSDYSDIPDPKYEDSPRKNMNNPPQPPKKKENMRTEMKGPDRPNIDNLLQALGDEKNVTVENDSVISVDDLASLTGSKQKGKSKKRGSDKSISLAI
uniref:Uncharacterized protein n=1 Tax=Florenciella sp. virus SA2 TaxID=3240092 RepID=A0AB39JF19_9VIRU